MMKSFNSCSVAPLFLVIVLSAFCAANVLRFESNADVICPEAGVVCEGPSSTCCRSQSGGWSCCPFKDGQCCSDGAHCCPSGSTCDVTRSACLPLTNTSTSTSTLAWPAVRRNQPSESSSQSSSVKTGLVCPDKKSLCPLSKAACCRDYIGRYGCCNHPTNVCCDDGQHCCYAGTVCDGLNNHCLSTAADSSISWVATTSATPSVVKDSKELESSIQVDPSETEMLAVADSNSEEHQPKESVVGVNGYCPDGSICFGTCCLQSVSPLRYGCCPYSYATCCPGGRTCCPSGYHCVGTQCVRL